jgi:5'(3')-deoxyribonucleotidase
MKTQTIVFDIDGVLADFVAHFTKTAGRVTEKPLPVTCTYGHIAWDLFPGLSPEDVTKTWAYIAHNSSFWTELPSLLSEEDRNQLTSLRSHTVYFATSRRTPGALSASKEWIYANLGIVQPSVVVTHRKGEFCKVVDANYFIDDKSENVDCAIWMTDGRTKSYVIDRIYNQGAAAPHSSKARRVTTVGAFIEEAVNGR